MVHKYSLLGFIEGLLHFSPRQGRNETLAANYIVETLRSAGVNYTVQEFMTYLPEKARASLTVDGCNIACQPCSFVGGVIEGKDHLVSSLIGSKYLLELPNINFNPWCDSISQSNYYFAPAVAVAADDVRHIMTGKQIRAEVVVEKAKHISKNILVGNNHDPEHVLFAHYDSIQSGAIDNASGVAVLIGLILSEPGLLKNNLFVLTGNEELSYDKPTYWGHGYRAFETDNFRLLTKAKKIMVVDSVGNTPSHFDQNQSLLYLGFPIVHANEWAKKIWLLYGDINHLMTVYHSNDDLPVNIKERYLKEASALLLDHLR